MVESLNRLLLSAKFQCFGMLLGFEPEVGDGGVLGVQTVMMEGSESQAVLGVAQEEG